MTTRQKLAREQREKKAAGNLLGMRAYCSGGIMGIIRGRKKIRGELTYFGETFLSGRPWQSRDPRLLPAPVSPGTVRVHMAPMIVMAEDPADALDFARRLRQKITFLANQHITPPLADQNITPPGSSWITVIEVWDPEKGWVTQK